jgi:FkbM family methyltransferase
VSGEDPEGRRDFYDRAADLTPFLGARAGSGVYIVRTRDKHIGKSLFSKAGRGEMNVLARAVAVLESLYGQGVLIGKSLIDVGANIGTTTIPALLDHGFGRVVAIEPEEDNFVTLRLNVVLNQVEDRVLPLCKAASNRVGTAELIVNPERGGKHWIATDIGKNVRVRDTEAVVRVDTITLDQLAEDDAFDPDLTGLLWIDAEGHEGQIIEGAQALTSRGVPIVLEWNPRALDQSGGRVKIEEIANTAYSHFAPMRADQSGDEPKFWLRPTDQLGAYAERFVGPSRIERLTDILLLRLSPDQLPTYSLAEDPPSDLIDLSANVKGPRKIEVEDASTERVGRLRSVAARFVDRLRGRQRG